MMRELFYSILSILVLAVFFYSCSFNTSVYVEKPGKITLPQDVKRLLIVDRTLNGKRNHQKMIASDGFMDIKGVSKTSLFAQVLAEFRSNERIESATSQILTFVEVRKWNESIQPLSPYLVDSLCSAHDADGIIALERFSNYSSSLNDDIFSRMREVRAVWKLYDVNSGGILNNHDYYNNSLSINNRSEYHSIPKGWSRTKLMSSIAAVDYIRHIAPHKVKESRSIYKSDNKSMKMAEHYFEAEDYTSAREIYESSVDMEEANNKVVGRLFYNIAITYELEDDLDKALEYAELSKSRGCSRASSYVRNLQSQLSNESVIELQKKVN